MLRRTDSSSATHPRASTARWYVKPPIPARIPRPNVIPTVLAAVTNETDTKPSLSLVRPDYSPVLTSLSDDEDGWGSDFEGISYTDEEMADFNKKFAKDTQDIEQFNKKNNVPNFNRGRVPPPLPPRRAGSSMTAVTNVTNNGQSA